MVGMPVYGQQDLYFQCLEQNEVHKEKDFHRTHGKYILCVTTLQDIQSCDEFQNKKKKKNRY